MRIGFVKVAENASGGRAGARLSRAAAGISAKSGCWAKAAAHRDLYGAGSRGSGAHRRRRFSPHDERVSRTSAQNLARWRTARRAEPAAPDHSRQRSARSVPGAGPDGSAEPADARSGKMHALRQLRPRLRRRARRRHPSDPRRTALRQIIWWRPPAGQCRDPLCMVGCPVGSIRRRNSLEVIIEDWCIGCGLCAKNCPYGNITLHPFEVIGTIHAPGARPRSKQKATSCDLCTRSRRTELRIRLPARCGASRGTEFDSSQSNS